MWHIDNYQLRYYTCIMWNRELPSKEGITKKQNIYIYALNCFFFFFQKDLPINGFLVHDFHRNTLYSHCVPPPTSLVYSTTLKHGYIACHEIMVWGIMCGAFKRSPPPTFTEIQLALVQNICNHHFNTITRQEIRKDRHQNHRNKQTKMLFGHKMY